MRTQVLAVMNRLAETYIQEKELRELLQESIRDKAAEHGFWSDLTRKCHFMLGGDSPHIDSLAAVTETVLLALDIADDLQDRDNFGKPWMRCPAEYAINAMLALLSAASGELGRLREADPAAPLPSSVETARLIARAVDGQQRDLNRSTVDEARYIAMVEDKSGSLIRFAMYMGYAGIPGLSGETAEKLNGLAACIGVMSQIGNDSRDISRFDVKSDILQRKRTLPALFLLQRCDESFPLLRQFYEGAVPEQALLDRQDDCLRFIEESGCMEYARIIQTLYLQHARELLDSIPGDPAGKAAFAETAFASYGS
jgi:competence protein ComQ